MAVIHRDGGHYADDHGLEKAGEDAEALVLKERVDTRELKAVLKEAAQNLYEASELLRDKGSDLASAVYDSSMEAEGESHL